MPSAKEMDEYCEENGFCGWFETSAKTGVGLDAAFKLLVKEIFKNDSALELQAAAAADSLRLTSTPAATQNSGGCCLQGS